MKWFLNNQATARTVDVLGIKLQLHHLAETIFSSVLLPPEHRFACTVDTKSHPKMRVVVVVFQSVKSLFGNAAFFSVQD